MHDLVLATADIDALAIAAKLRIEHGEATVSDRAFVQVHADARNLQNAAGGPPKYSVRTAEALRWAFGMSDARAMRHIGPDDAKEVIRELALIAGVRP